MSERKTDTRIKIHLGGLIVKAGLDHLDPALLYGGLLAMKRTLTDPARRDGFVTGWTKMGSEAGVPSHPKGVRNMITSED